MYGDTRQQAGWDTVKGARAGSADALAWRSLRGPASTSGPSRLELTGAGPGSEPAEASEPGSGLDALLASSAAAIAARLELGDLGGAASSHRQDAHRLSAHLDAAWAGELGLAAESPLLDLLVEEGPQPLDPGAEAALGASLAKALELGIDIEGVDVSLLRDAAGPLEDLLATLPVWHDGLGGRLQLDDDVLQLARTAWRLLHVTHQAWFASRNRSLAGDSRHVFHHPVDTWARQLAVRAPSVVERVHILRTLEGAGEELGELVKQHFTWASTADRAGFSDWLDGRLSGPVETVLSLVDPGATELAVRLAPHLPELEDEDDVADAVDVVGRCLEAWLQTDAGLLARLHRELHLASDTWSWRRVGLETDGTEWSVADVPAAARAAADALDLGELLADPARSA